MTDAKPLTPELSREESDENPLFCIRCGDPFEYDECGAPEYEDRLCNACVWDALDAERQQREAAERERDEADRMLTSGLAQAHAERDEALRWGDSAQPEDDAIKSAHPSRTGKHETYGEAMRLVGARRSKGALVALVNWLLAERDEATRKWHAIGDELKAEMATTEHLRAQLRVVHAGPDNVWRWQGQGDEPQSLSCPVVMSADTLQSILAERKGA
jgi:hypothetical protein